MGEMVDAGEVTVTVGEKVSRAHLTVEELQTEFLTPLKDKSVVENSSVEFMCEVNIPVSPEKVQWLLSGSPVLIDDKRFTASTKETTVKLCIPSVQMVDAGEVTVTVGEKESKAKLRVEAL